MNNQLIFYVQKDLSNKACTADQKKTKQTENSKPAIVVAEMNDINLVLSNMGATSTLML